jgi:uncharacterized repeat protein (TIGR03803 family)
MLVPLSCSKRVFAAYIWLLCVSAAMGMPAVQPQTAIETVLHNFAAPPNGMDPWPGVIRDSAGNFYGTADGGRYGFGVVYKLDTTGNQTVLHNFTGGADGGNPFAGVIRDARGNLYGTTNIGGSANAGTVYKVDPASHETVLYSFTGGLDGGHPEAGVILDPAGNLYGTTQQGGAAGWGVVYELDTSGNETVLYSFAGMPDGGYPEAGVIRDAAGTLYGTTYYGGAWGFGTVYKVNASGHETVLYSFTGGADGGYPQTALIRDAAGVLYGTCGSVVYRVDSPSHETVLYSFTGGADGGNANSGLIRDSAGNLYGTTTNGGTANAGVVYKLDTSHNETVLHSFTGPAADGGYPFAGVVRDSAGNLYGTAQQGGSANLGTVYKLDRSGNETLLYSFPGPADGSVPYAGVTGDSAGNLYGTTYNGGPANAGVVYKLDATGHETVLHSFAGGADGGNPDAGVTRCPNGNFYGTTYFGGTANMGVVYEMDAAGQYTVLHSFTGGADGGHPYAGVTCGSAGNLYGTTVYGGNTVACPAQSYLPGGCGVVFALDGSGNETVLYSFTGGADGGYPYAGVILDSSGNLYGTTASGGSQNCYLGCGVVYRLNSTRQETVLYSFMGAPDGGDPKAGVIRDSAGNLYGIAGLGAAYGGVVFKLDTTGQETVLYSFTGGTDGGNPVGLIRDPAGNFYGTTQYGGIGGAGVVFGLDTKGKQRVLYSFTGGADGGSPYAGVIRDSTGNLYGAASSGGKEGTGVVFRLTPQ